MNTARRLVALAAAMLLAANAFAMAQAGTASAKPVSTPNASAQQAQQANSRCRDAKGKFTQCPASAAAKT